MWHKVILVNGIVFSAFIYSSCWAFDQDVVDDILANHSEPAVNGGFPYRQEIGVTKNCEVQDEIDETVVTSPTLRVKQYLWVTDVTGDGFVRQDDINHFVDAANYYYELYGLYSSIKFDETKIVKYETNNIPRIIWNYDTVTLKSGALIDGNGHEFRMWSSPEVQNAFEVESGAFGTGIVNSTIWALNQPNGSGGPSGNGGNRVSSSLIHIKSDSESNTSNVTKYVYIFNNKIRGDSTQFDSDENNGSGITGVLVNSAAEHIYIYGNEFDRTPFGIKTIRAKAVKHLRISNNVFNNWRRNAIFSININNAPIEGGNNVKLHHNIITPPLPNKTSRQPIAFQAHEDSGGLGFETLDVLYNTINNIKEPHVPGELGSGTADNISLHGASNFLLWGNCIFGAGELGINASRGSKDGVIAFNYVEDSDIGGVNVQTNDDAIYPTQNIVVRNNVIINAAHNAEPGSEVSPDSLAGIFVEQATSIDVRNNMIDLSGLSNPIGAGIRLRGAISSPAPTDNVIIVPEGVCPIKITQ